MDLYDDQVIKTIKNSETVNKLLKHERNKQFLSTKGAYYYKNHLGKYVLLTGLLPRLRKTFYPDSNFFNLMKKPKAEKITKRRKIALARNQPPKQKKVKQSRESKGRHWGKIKGTAVHEEIEDFLFMDKKGFTKKHPSIHIYTKRILSFVLETMGWTLIKSELGIFDEGLGIGTEIDLTGATKEGDIVLMEIKCGYRDTWDRSDGYMHGCLHSLTNSPHHLANLQLITEALLLVKNYQIPLKKMLLYVIRVDDEGLYSYQVSNAFVEKKGPKIYRDLLLNNNSAVL